MKFLGGIVTGFLLTVLSLFGFYKYSTSPAGQVGRCVNLYMATDLEQDESIQALAKEKGLTVKELVKSRCETWVSNGDKF